MAFVSFAVVVLVVMSFPWCCQAQRSDPSQFNGGSILAMAGRNSVAIAIDARFGLGMQTISTGDDSRNSVINVSDADIRHEIENDRMSDKGGEGSGVGNPRLLQLPNSNALLAWTGLYGDGIGFAEEMNILLASKVRKAGMLGFGGMTTKRNMSPRAITMLISHLLYRRRNAPYYVETVVVGLETVRVPLLSQGNKERDDGELEGHDSDGSTSRELQSVIQDDVLQDRRTNPRATTSYRTIQKPYLCGTDMLGAKSSSQSFVCSGVASRSLYGTAEALWEPDLEGDKLVEICGRAFLSALERDILSGYGAVVYLIQGGQYEDDVQIVEYILSCRND